MTEQPSVAKRIYSIDLLRGLIILFMLLDHVRETVYLHLQVGDPMNVQEVSPLLFFSRILAHICAPSFIFLAGLSAYLYGTKFNNDLKKISSFLFTRGLFLIFLEVIVINFAWTAKFPPEKVFLQVIWAIGISMIALSFLLRMPKTALITLSVIIIAGHNALDNIHAAKDSIFYIPWAILHDRGWIEFETIRFRTSYPVLPWIGIISLGYCFGSYFEKGFSALKRQKTLALLFVGCLAAFVILRYSTAYGDKLPWQHFESTGLTVMSFFNVTKYPPSLDFVLLTFSLMFLLLLVFEKLQDYAWTQKIMTFGTVSLFFYIVHLYVLKVIYVICEGIFGKNKGDYFGVGSMVEVWIITIILAIALYPLMNWFSKFKREHKHWAWLKYL